MRCILVLGGPEQSWMRFPPMLQKDDFIIACDGGYPAAQKIGWTPQVAVGDFDTYQGSFATETQVIVAPPEKDDTDAILGVRVGLERGYREFLVVGALGGRLDHTIANLQMLSFLNANQARGELYSPENRVWLAKNETIQISKIEGWYLSVFAWGGVCSGVTLEGVAYPLQNGTLTPEFPIGVSNGFIAAKASITAGNGTLLVVVSKN